MRTRPTLKRFASLISHSSLRRLSRRTQSLFPALERLEDRTLLSTLAVTNTADSGAGSFRQAILDSNATVGVADTIEFNIGTGGAQTIQPLSALPTITDPVVINGSTQSGYAGSPIIELDGSLAGTGAQGLIVTAGNSTIRALVINRFDSEEIVLTGAGGNIVQGNYIGTATTGLSAAGGAVGILIDAGAANNTIGGLTTTVGMGNGNIISGLSAQGIVVRGTGTNGTVIQGNMIGLGVDGSTVIPNGSGVPGGVGSGITLSNGSGAIIGGTDPLARNVISGNGIGILLCRGTTIGFQCGSASVGNLDVTINGNFIGTDITGMLDRQNVTGIAVNTGSGSIIGGSAPGAGNVISGNRSGISVGWENGTGTTIQGNLIGVAADGMSPLGNSFKGIALNSDNNIVGGLSTGEGNIIAYNGSSTGPIGGGIGLAPNSSSSPIVVGNVISGNSTFDNIGLGIDIGITSLSPGVTPNDSGDGDGIQNFPILTSVTSGMTTSAISGTLNSTANSTFTLEFFSNSNPDPTGFGEGETLLGSKMVAIGPTGNVSFTAVLSVPIPVGRSVTATATKIGSGTSEFSENFIIVNVTPSITSAATVNVAENQTAVIDVQSSDPDGDTEGGGLTYSLTGGADTALFSIDTNTGVLTFNPAPNFEAPGDVGGNNVYDVQVTVTDSGGLTGTQNIAVTVTNVTATISGTVFVDADTDGLFDGGTETAIDAVIVELLNSTGGLLDSDLTSMGGVYGFEVDDEFATYRIRETQPTGVDDGAAILGDANGNSITGEAVDGSVVSSNEMLLTLTGIDASDYDFTEVGDAVEAGDTATIGFWQNKNGQSLIKEGGTVLVAWLNNNFGNIFGDTFSDGAGGDDDAEVASFYKNEFFKKKLKGTSKVDAQFMATALATFFTSSNLSGGNVAASYGFNVTETGIGTNTVNVGSSGAAFGVADNTDVTIMALLLATNDLTGADNDGDASEDYSHVYDADGDGVLSDAEKAMRAMANSLYTFINESGDI